MQDHAQKRTVILRPPLYSMNPSLRNLFMKKFTRDRVVPTISARNSCESWQQALRLSCLLYRASRRGPASRFLAGVGDLIDEVFLDADVARQHVRDEPVRERRLLVEHVDHLGFVEDQHGNRVIAVTVPMRSADPPGSLLEKVTRPSTATTASLPVSDTTESFTVLAGCTSPSWPVALAENAGQRFVRDALFRRTDGIEEFLSIERGRLPALSRLRHPISAALGRIFCNGTRAFS